MWLETLISISEWLFLLYFLGLTAAYLMLDLIAIVHLRAIPAGTCAGKPAAQLYGLRAADQYSGRHTMKPPRLPAPFARCCNSVIRNMKSS